MDLQKYYLLGLDIFTVAKSFPACKMCMNNNSGDKLRLFESVGPESGVKRLVVKSLKTLFMRQNVYGHVSCNTQAAEKQGVVL